MPESAVRALHVGRDPQGSRYAALRLARRFRQALAELQAQPAASPGVSIGSVLALHGRASIGTLLMLFALLSNLPVGGAGNVFGVALWWLSWDWLRGRDGMRLPQRVMAMRLSPRWSRVLLRGLAVGYRHAGKWLRPRWRGLQAPWTRGPWAAWIAFQAWIIFLPIPMGNVLPGVSLVALGLGRMLDDGLMLWASLVLGLLGAVYGLVLWQLTWLLMAATWRHAGNWLAGFM